MLTYRIETHELEFIKPAKTSRNEFSKRLINLVYLSNEKGREGVGECAPLSLLSIDDIDDYYQQLEKVCMQLCSGTPFEELELTHLPSIRFGLECALISLEASDALFPSSFTRGECQIPINGLVWMNNTESMLMQAFSKAEEGYRCIKFKVGALDFDEECRMLEQFRARYNAFKIEIRLDANGAFHPLEASEQLKELQRFEVHSIEQPIGVNQWDAMANLCHKPLISIALDEELIHTKLEDASKMLDVINPQFVVLKPNLIGGLSVADQWIQQCQLKSVPWWATSALESNIGLNAIAQWVSQYEPTIYQGLGTGALYKNNFNSPLKIERGYMRFVPEYDL